MNTSKTTFAIICAMLIALTSFAQQNANQMWYVYKIQVKPDKIEDFRTFYSQFAQTSRTQNKQHSLHLFRSLSPVFYQFQRVDDFNDVENLSKENWGIVDKMEKGSMEIWFESVESWHGFFIKSIDSLSYYPENMPVIGQDLLYAEWWINHIETGKMGVYAKTFDLANQKSTEAGFDYPVGRFEITLGMEKPAIITVFWGKDVADLYKNATRSWEVIGDEAREMINNFDDSRRRMEKISMWYLPELSYVAN